jgi:hypothetical protein
MIRIRHLLGEYEVAGAPAELRTVADRLKQLATSSEVEEVLVCDAAFDPKPYANLLPRLRLSRRDAKDRVSASREELVLSGSREGLLRLASFFDMPDDAEDGFHVRKNRLLEERQRSEKRANKSPEPTPRLATIRSLFRRAKLSGNLRGVAHL